MDEALSHMEMSAVFGGSKIVKFDEVQCTEYGFGWTTDIYRGTKMLSHGGNTNGFSSQLALLPKEKFAVVVLSNAASSFSVEALSNYLADEVLGVQDIPDWSAKYQEVFNKMMGEAKAGMQKRAEAKIPDTTLYAAVDGSLYSCTVCNWR